MWMWPLDNAMGTTAAHRAPERVADGTCTQWQCISCAETPGACLEQAKRPRHLWGNKTRPAMTQAWEHPRARGPFSLGRRAVWFCVFFSPKTSRRPIGAQLLDPLSTKFIVMGSVWKSRSYSVICSEHVKHICPNSFKSASQFFFFFSFFLLILTASRSRSRPLCSALYFSASSGIDSFLLILFLITWFSFFHLIIFSVLFFFFISLGFISDSLFIFLALSQVFRFMTSLVSGNFYQLLVYNSILVYLWFCVCYGFDLQSIIVVKYSLQSIILLFVYVVLMNLFVDKMVAAVVLMNLFVNKMVSL